MGSSVASAASLTCATHFSVESVLASIRFWPFARMSRMQLVIQSTCCSMAIGMLHNTDGLPGPVMVNRSREFRRLQAKVSARAGRPGILQLDTLAAADV